MHSNVEERSGGFSWKPSVGSKGDVVTQKHDCRLYQQRYGLQIQGGDSLLPPVTGQALGGGKGFDFDQLDHVQSQTEFFTIP